MCESGTDRARLGWGREQDGRTSRRIARREYHKKIERKRRDRMRSLYDELRSLTDAAELADKNGVLEGAISVIQQLRQENSRLKLQKTNASVTPQALPHPSSPPPLPHTAPFFNILQVPLTESFVTFFFFCT